MPEVHELFDFDERLFDSDLGDCVETSDARQFALRLTVIIEI